MVKTNIIYITTRCNMACTYCYQQFNRKSTSYKERDITISEIHEFVDEIVEREGEEPSSIVIFGGEPMLRCDLIAELIKYCYSKKNSFSFYMTTNGTLLSNKNILLIKKFIQLAEKHNSLFTLCVSFDVSVQYQRIFSNGNESKSIVLKNLEKLRENNIPYYISYTLTDKNNSEIILNDILYCILVLKATRVKVNWEYKSYGQERMDVIRKDLLTKLEYVYLKYNIPICEVVCDKCKRCDRHKISEDSFFIPEVGIIKKSKKITQKNFKHFII